MIDLPPLTFSYGTVERALAVAYGIPAERRAGAFRSMLSNLQRHGVLGPQSRIGRGAHLDYTPVEMHRLVLALELCELGVPPAATASILDTYWEGALKPIVFAAARSIGLVPEQPEGYDTVLFLGGIGLRTDSLRGAKAPVAPIIDRCALDELPVAMKRWMAATPGDPAPRGLVMNFSARLRAFHDALADANLADALDGRAAAINEARRPDLSRLEFRFAKTMPEIPHWYVVRTSENAADYIALFHAIQEKGVTETFGKARYRYWRPGDGFKYWTMTTDVSHSHVINRAKIDDDHGAAE